MEDTGMTTEDDETDDPVADQVHQQTRQLLAGLCAQEEISADMVLSVISGMAAGLAEFLWVERPKGGTIEQAIETWTVMGTIFLRQFEEQDKKREEQAH